jgi:predicted lipoprotein
MMPLFAAAQSVNRVIVDTVDAHVLPRFQSLATTTAELAKVAHDDCTPTQPLLRAAYGRAFDAWIAASHLRLGPSEIDGRAFALAFWPDSRGVTPRTLNTLIADQDPVADGPKPYAQVSIAARGFYALELLLFDDTLMEGGNAAYHCTLVQTVAADIAATSAAIAQDWQTGFAQELLKPEEHIRYRSNEEVLQELFKALMTGLQFTSETRLGRPLGTFDHPRPMRAESWRSGRSAQHVAVSLNALNDLAGHLTSNNSDLAAQLSDAFSRAQIQLEALEDPVFAGVADPQRRLKIEVLQQSVDAIRATVRSELGPILGVTAGFNSLDGD